MERIEPKAFLDTNLENIDFPSTLKIIGNESFGNAFKGTTLEIPANVEQINANAFSGMNNTQNILIKNRSSKLLTLYSNWSGSATVSVENPIDEN